jgi:hypothetical protein
MLTEDLIIRNPLQKIIGAGNAVPKGGFGAVLARAGVGKTAFIVQVAMNGLLQHTNVLHISLGEPVQKVALWYEEVFRNSAEQNAPAEMTKLWESILVHRFIMTFQKNDFTAPKLEERLADLTEQAIFLPQIVLIDGLSFAPPQIELIHQLKTLAEKSDLRFWFTIRTHRDETPGENGLPNDMVSLADLFSVIIALDPRGQEVDVCLTKGGVTQPNPPTLQLDPSTMLVRQQ